MKQDAKSIKLRKKRKVYRMCIALFAAVIGVLILFAIVQLFGSSNLSEITNIFLLFVLAVFFVADIVGIAMMPPAWNKLGLYALHIGLAIFLAGQFMYYSGGALINVSMEASQFNSYSKIEDKNATVHDLGFSFKLTDFVVLSYDPVYDIYDIKSGKLIKSDITADKQGVFDFGKYGGKVQADALKESDKMKTAVTLELDAEAKLRMEVKRYEGTISISKDGTVENKIIAVNEPLRVNGWKIYLMNHEPVTKTVTIAFKKDSGEFFSTFGLIIMVLGAIYVCIIKDFVNRKKNALKIQAANTSTRRKRKENNTNSRQRIEPERQKTNEDLSADKDAGDGHGDTD